MQYFQQQQQQQQHERKANLPTLQNNNPYFSSDYLYLKQQQQELKSLEPTSLFPLSYNLTNKQNNNNSPDSGLKEMSFDSNISDIFNTTPNNNDLAHQLNNIDSTKYCCDESTTNDDYTNSPLNTNGSNLNYLYNIKRKLNSFKTSDYSTQQQQQLNDLSKASNKENFLITISKKQLNPLQQVQNYSLYMNTPSTLKKTQPVFIGNNETYKKTKSVSSSSIDNYSLSEGYDSFKQNDEDIIRLQLNRYGQSNSVTNSDENVINEESSSDDEEKLIKYT
jgi:hypothetical protein